MQLAVDWDLCIGSGRCAAASGGAFALVAVAGGHRAVLTDPTVPDTVLVAAARACPMLAIRLHQADRRVYPPESPARLA